MELAAYGVCVKSIGEKIEKSACEAEFVALKACLKKAGRGGK